MDLQSSVVKFTLISCACVILAWSGFIVVRRIEAERANRRVALCADFNSLLNAAISGGVDPLVLLKDLKAAGLTAVAVDEETVASLIESGEAAVSRVGSLAAVTFYDTRAGERFAALLKDRYGIDAALKTSPAGATVQSVFSSGMVPAWFSSTLPAGFSERKTALAERAGLHVVLRPHDDGNPRWLSQKEIISRPLLFDGRALPGYPGNEARLAETLSRREQPFILIEFAPVAGKDAFGGTAARRLVLGHAITGPELARPAPVTSWLQRWRRAVDERGVRFLLLYSAPQWSPSELTAYVGKVGRMLQKRGYEAGACAPPGYPLQKSLPLRSLLVVLAAIAGPPAGLWLAQRRNGSSFLIRYALINVVALAVALVIAALFFDVRYMQKITAAPPVKCLMLAPLSIAALMLAGGKGWKELMKRPVTMGHAALAGAIVATVAVMLLRSGNFAPEWIQPEEGMRSWLETLLAVRPRTKEFLFGYPLLMTGLYYRRSWLVWLGMIAPVSVINTFLHAHTPVMISLLRSFNGFWLGTVIGFILIALTGRLSRRYPTSEGC